MRRTNEGGALLVQQPTDSTVATESISTPGGDVTRCAQCPDVLGEEIKVEEIEEEMAESGEHESDGQYTDIPGVARDAINSSPPVADLDPLLGKIQSEREVASGSSSAMKTMVKAALMGNFDKFTSLLRVMEDSIDQDQLREALTATSGRGEGSLIAAAAKGGSTAVFSVAVDLLDGEVMRVIADSWPHGRTVLVDAAKQGLHDFNAVVKILDKRLDIDQAMNAVSYNQAGGKITSFTAVAQKSSRLILQAWAEILSTALPPEIMTEACTTSFAACVKEPHLLQNLSVLFAYGAEVSSMDLVELARLVSLDQLKACFLDGLSLVDNPFPAGSHLSVAIENALDSASAAERRALSGLQETLDDVLVEVLERLPRAVAEFPGGVNGCAVIFEPEIAGTRGENYRGPVRLALSEKKWGQTFCASPLVFEYISHKFTAGLPDLKDTGNLLGKAAGAHSGSPAEGRDFLYSTQMVANSVLGRMMQGSGLMEWGSESTRRPRDWDRILGGTLLPGAQFIAIGVLTRPKSYYKVPALRMLLDFCAHLLVLSLYTTVALRDHDVEVTVAEMVLKFYILAELVQGFIQREWDWLDMSAIFLLASATIANLLLSSGNVGRALFAVSAPLLFARLLFFGKIFKRQGVVIQAIGIMLNELAHFGLVLGVIMMGFTLGFFVLFFDEINYSDIWLDVFKAMLGETDVFEDFYEDALGEIAKLLLVVYLFVVSILLLNLLIAVLSTAHARIDEAQERAFTSSKIGFITLYSGHVEKDSVPAPFNLVQFALWLPAVAIDRLWVRDGCHRLSANVARVTGVFFFWLVLGPLGFLATWPLWVLSVPHRVRAVSRGTSWRGLAWQILAVVMLHTMGVPFIMFALWIKSGMELLMSFLKSVGASLRGRVSSKAEIKTTPSNRYDVYEHRRDSVSVTEMLNRAPGSPSVREILGRFEETSRAERAQLQEEQSHPATVAHIMEMRDHLASTSRKECATLLSRLESDNAILSARVDALAETVKRRILMFAPDTVGGSATLRLDAVNTFTSQTDVNVVRTACDLRLEGQPADMGTPFGTPQRSLFNNGFCGPSIFDDPHVSDLRGQRYDWFGEDGGKYAFLSTPAQLQMNLRYLEGLQGDVNAVAVIQSNHEVLRIETPNLSLYVNVGINTEQEQTLYDGRAVPTPSLWRMDMIVEHEEGIATAKGMLGETAGPVAPSATATSRRGGKQCRVSAFFVKTWRTARSCIRSALSISSSLSRRCKFDRR
eukprot:g11098.t1